MQRHGFLAIAAIAVFVIGLFAVAGSLHGDNARASHAGGMDAMSIDLDITGNSPTALGAVDSCVVATPGSSVTFDLTADNIPPDTAAILFSASIFYDKSPGRLRIEAANVSQFLAVAPGSNILDTSDAAPDTTSNPFWVVGALDTGNNSAESGSGVLARITMSIAGSTPAGLYPVTLDGAAHIDALNNAYAPDILNNATLAVGTACPTEESEADLAVQAVSIDTPATVNTGTPFAVTGEASVHNNGPAGPANGDLQFSLSIPPDCQATDPLVKTIQDVSLDMSSTVTLGAGVASWSVSCTDESTHGFTLSATVTLDAPGLNDTEASNNSGSAAGTTALTGAISFALNSLVVSAPSDETVATGFEVHARATVSNSGPHGPVSSQVTYSLVMPSGCTLYAQNFLVQTANVSVGGGAQVDADEVLWRVKCDMPGTYAFTVNASAAISQLHLTDSSTGNDAASGQASVVTRVPICGDDPTPDGDVLQNMSPALLQIILNLTAEGNVAPAGQTTQLDCNFVLDITDAEGAPIDDCQVNLVPPAAPCSISFDISIDQVGGTPLAEPGANLLPIGVQFFPAGFTFEPDLAITDGSPAGSGYFNIKTDGGLGPQGLPCFLEVKFSERTGFEGGILPNAPDSNLSPDMENPLVWPNDLNAERALVESSLQLNPLVTALQLHSRMVVPLFLTAETRLPLNVLTWRVTDPLVQAATGAQWVVVAFPGDAVNPDPAGPGGGNPDADDIIPQAPTRTCTPFSAGVTFTGTAGGSLRAACATPGSHMAWSLLDPNATGWSGDQGPRSDVSPCSLDADGDGLTAAEETYYGTNALDADSDDDTVGDGPDNCKITANPAQADFDSDGEGDVCDSDVDGDSVSNTADFCPLTAPASQVDSNGCATAQVDSDSDGICNPGAPSSGPAPGCTGTDNCPAAGNPTQADFDGDGAGDPCDLDEDADGVAEPTELCNFTQLGAAVDGAGCSNAQVDPDGDGVCTPGAPSGGPGGCSGTDNCPSVANEGQENSDNDGFGDACDLDNDGDGVNDADEAACLGDPDDPGVMPERLDGAYAGIDDDGDTLIDEGLPAGATTFDCDGDGWAGQVETHVFSNAAGKDQDPCGVDAWPADHTGGFFSGDKVNVQDLAAYVAEPRRLNTSPGDPDYDVRFDVLPGGTLGGTVNVQDLVAMVISKPAMFGGLRAFNGPICTP